MLRSLIKDTTDGRYGQPKPRKEMNDGEKRYLDVKAPAREKEMWRRRARARAREVSLDLAADALAKQAGRQTDEE